MPDDKSLVLKAKEYQALIESLKRFLIAGQLGFLKAGEILTKIKEEELYKLEDSSEEWSWSEFTAKPDLPLPGRTPESRRRVADALIRVYKIFVVKHKIDLSRLAGIGWTKLDLLARICESGDSRLVEEWISKAETLTVNDLFLEMKNDNKEQALQVCDHSESYPIWICPSCGLKSKEPLV